MDVFQTMPLWDQSLAQVQWGAAVGASLAGAAFDLWTRRIPNRLTGPVLALGLVWALWVCGWGGLAESVLGCALLGAPFVVLWLYGGGGAGDAKLMGAV
ncbi:MAG: A24 family peptidase, partial [Candidatus Hydrogenedentes bacterium]|nr:A24 family peptidase [Candidatus Hydrogenedentota bacterium]